MDSKSKKDDVYVNLSSTQERLMKEMNAYLAAIAYSPGEETTCSVDTRKADNRSSYDSSAPLSARLKVPSCLDTPPDSNGGEDEDEPKQKASYSDTSAESERVDEREERNESQKKAGSSRKNGNLNSIDEDGGEDISFAQYEYYNDFDRHSSHGSCNQFEDDDSLVAMAKRMDAASIVSDPSTIVGPSERFLALPQPKILKKLGQKMQSNRAKPPPPPRNGTKSPRPPAKRLSQKIINTKNSGSPALPPNTPNPRMLTSLPFNPSGSDEVSNLSETNHTGESTISNVDLQPQNVNDDSQENDKEFERSSSSGSAKSIEHDDNEVIVPEQSPVSDTKPTRASTPKGRRKSSSKNATSKESRSSRGDRKRSKKQSRKHSSRLSTSPIAKSRGGEGSDYLPANLKPEPTYKEKNAGRRKGKKKGARDSSRENSKKDRKKRLQKKQIDSDDEPMQGVGFNTRIHDKNNDDIKPKSSISEQMPNQSHDDARASKKSHGSPSQMADSMRGIGFNTRINDKNDDIGPNSIPDQTTKHTRDDAQSPKKSRGQPSQTMDTEFETYYYESSEGETSSYSSDDQTQIFYESTDDDDFTDSEDELLAVGTSVADAVKDLNNKRAVTKVKSLFGIRR